MQVLPLLSANFLDRVVGGEGNTGDGSFSRDVHMSLVSMIPRLELDRSGCEILASSRYSPKPVLSMHAASRSLDLVGADGRFDAASDGAPEEAEDPAAFLAVLGVLGGVDVGATRLVRCSRIVRHGFVQFFLGRIERPVCPCGAKLSFADVGGLLRWRVSDVWWRRKRCFVGFADAEERDRQLCIGRNTFENGVSNFKEPLPVGELPIEELQSRLDDGITEESKPYAKGSSLYKHV